MAPLSRLRPRGLIRALFAMALAQTLVAGIAVIARLGPPLSWPVEIMSLNGFFVALFVGLGLLSRYAALEQTPAGTAPEG